MKSTIPSCSSTNRLTGDTCRLADSPLLPGVVSVQQVLLVYGLQLRFSIITRLLAPNVKLPNHHTISIPRSSASH